MHWRQMPVCPPKRTVHRGGVLFDPFPPQPDLQGFEPYLRFAIERVLPAVRAADKTALRRRRLVVPDANDPDWFALCMIEAFACHHVDRAAHQRRKDAGPALGHALQTSYETLVMFAQFCDRAWWRDFMLSEAVHHLQATIGTSIHSVAMMTWSGHCPIGNPQAHSERRAL